MDAIEATMTTWARFTLVQDDILRQVWDGNRYGRRAAQIAAVRTGFTANQCARRAAELMLVFTRERQRWTDAEIVVVSNNAHQSLETIQRKLAKLKLKGLDGQLIKRTRSAIARVIFRNRFRTNLNGLRQSELALAFGVSAYKIKQWEQRGLLRGKALPSIDQHKNGLEGKESLVRFYPHRVIRKFIYNNPREFDLRKVQQEWFLDLLRPSRVQAYDAGII